MLLPFAASELYLRRMPEFRVGGWIALLGLGVGTTATMFALRNHALWHRESWAVGLYYNPIPVAELAFAVMLARRWEPCN